MKKLFAIMLSLCLLASLLFVFASCGSSGNDNGKDGTSDSESTNTVGSSADGTTSSTVGGTSNSSGATGGNTDNTQGGNTDSTSGSQGGNTDSTQGGNTDSTSGSQGSDDKPARPSPTEITVEDWKDLLSLDNYALTIVSDDTSITIYVDGNVSKVTTVYGTVLTVIKGEYVYEYEERATQNGTEYVLVTSSYEPTATFSFGASFLEDLGLNSLDAFYELSYDKETQLYCYLGTPLLSFRDGMLVSVLGIYEVSQHGSTVIENIPNIDDLPGTEGGGEDEEDVTTITYEDWYNTINLKNFVYADSIQGFVYRVTENAYVIESDRDFNQLYIFEDGYVYHYSMDGNNQYYLVEKRTGSTDEIPTLGSIIGFTDPELFEELYYHEEQSCYFYSGYRFVFENGLLVDFNYGAYVSDHGNAVIEDMPQIGEGTDGEVRNEITLDEWNALFDITNYTLDMGSGVIYYVTESAVLITLDDYASLIVYRDGNVDTYETNGNGEYELISTVYDPSITSISIGKLLLSDVGDTNSSYYDLYYSEYEKCYYLNGKSFYFENGNLISYCGAYTFSNYGTTVVENIPEFDDSVRTEITFEEFASMFEQTNFTTGYKNSNDKIYHDGNVIVHSNYGLIEIFHEGNLYRFSYSDGEFTLYEIVKSYDYQASLGATLFGNDADIEKIFSECKYNANTGIYKHGSFEMKFENGKLVEYGGIALTFDHGTTVIENVPNLDDFIGTALEGGLTIDQWNDMVTTGNCRMVENSKNVYFLDSDKLYYYSSNGSYYMFNEFGHTYMLNYSNGEYYATDSLTYIELTIGGIFIVDAGSFFDLSYDSALGCYVLFREVKDGVTGTTTYSKYQFFFTDGVISKIITSLGNSIYTYDVYNIDETAVALPDYIPAY